MTRPAFTKRHFEAIAEILSGYTDSSKVRMLTAELADLFEETNSRFNRERFYTACGMQGVGENL